MAEFKRESWSKKNATSSKQDIKTNVPTSVCRREMPGSCFIVFLSALALEKIMTSRRCVVISRRSLIQIIAGLAFGDLSNGGSVFDKFTRAIVSKE